MLAFAHETISLAGSVKKRFDARWDPKPDNTSKRKHAYEVITFPRLLFSAVLWQEQKRVRISNPFLGPVGWAHFPQAPKNGPIPGSEFWEKIWAPIKNQCQMQFDNPDVASSSICSLQRPSDPSESCGSKTLTKPNARAEPDPYARPVELALQTHLNNICLPL